MYYIGEIRAFAHGAIPANWHVCDGSMLDPSTYAVLFAMISTTYGGDGTTTFGLPDLRGRFLLGEDAGHALGSLGGTEEVTLSINHLPAHAHAVRCNNGSSAQARPAGKVPGKTQSSSYDEPDASSTMDEAMIAPSGGDEPHNNMPPYGVVVFCIAVQ